MNYDYENEALAMINTHYGKVINMEECVDVFAQLDTRTLEHKTLLYYLICHTDIHRLGI